MKAPVKPVVMLTKKRHMALAREAKRLGISMRELAEQKFKAQEAVGKIEKA